MKSSGRNQVRAHERGSVRERAQRRTRGRDRHTIYDVAATAGVSISTVSRVLNTPDRVNDATRTKVLGAIDRLNYMPKAEARARALHGMRRIGVLTPFFTAPSFVQRLRGIDAALASHNYELIIYVVDSLARLRGYLASLPLTANLDGLMIMSLPFDEAEAKRLIKHRLETVSIESSHPEFSSVVIDDCAGGRLAARHLIAKGHRACAFMGDLYPPDYAIRPSAGRLNGFRQTLTEAGLSLPEDYVCAASNNPEPVMAVARQLLNHPQRPSAIFCAADMQALSVLRVAREFGLRVPQDLAVIGFDDLDIASYIGLTTIRQPLDDSGRIAAELLFARMQDAHQPVQQVRLSLEVVERETA
jgi:LacI family transcriptional regulator